MRNLIKKFVAYLEKDPDKRWFEPYGRSWVPITKQGWIVVFLFAIAEFVVVSASVLILANVFDTGSSPNVMFLIFIPFGLVGALFVYVMYKKGGRLR